MTVLKRVPLYAQVGDALRQRIQDLKVGAMLDSEIDLARELGVSPGTMRRALDTLEAEGFLDRQHGRGTRIASKDPAKCPHCGAPLKNGKA